MSVIGIDLGGTKILGVRAERDGSVLARLRWPTQASKGPDMVIGRIADMIGRLMPPQGVEAIGVAAPGPLNPDRGEVYNPPNLPGWETVPLRSLLYERLARNGIRADRMPIVLIKDASAAALAEFTFGAGAEHKAGRKIKHLVYLTISTGIGGGVVSDGRLVAGATGMAAELGHIVIDLNGPRCYCGGIGCLEAMASGTALAREGAVVVAARKPTAMARMVGHDPRKVTAATVIRAAQEGDPLARQLMDREGQLVGTGVVNCIHAFNPELVVLGGGVSMHAGELLFAPVRAAVHQRLMPAFAGTFEIVPAALGDASGALGAVAAALAAL
jgi:glucokinase